MGFAQGKIVEETEFGGLVFPKTLLPAVVSESQTSDLVEMVRRERAWLLEILQRHSAILFRGFNVCTAEDFADVVKAFGWDEMGHVGATSRVKVADRIYTANEAPLDQLINFHHEMSLVREFPSKIFFFCSQPSPEGGETSIVPSHIIVEKMEERMPEFVTKLSQTGFIFRFQTATKDDSSKVVSKTWQWVLKTNDPVEAEKRAKDKFTCSSMKFNTDGSAEFIFGPTNPIREFGGKKVWFNTILSHTGDQKGIGLRDGSPFPCHVVEAYQNTLGENCVDLSWHKGDILLVDNLTVQHARRPGKPPRVVLVSICK